MKSTCRASTGLVAGESSVILLHPSLLTGRRFNRDGEVGCRQNDEALAAGCNGPDSMIAERKSPAASCAKTGGRGGTKETVSTV